MSRTGEIVLASISAVFTVIGIILLAMLVVGGNTAFQDAAFISEFEQEILSDPTFTSQDAEVITQFMEVFINLFGLFGWGFIISLVISLVLNIIGIVSVNKNKKPKKAGILFIVAGLFAGVLSLTSILLYVAAIMCFVRKPPVQFAEQEEYYSAKETL
jgi:phosphoglycerol transferase MdoB-like AlkP superfamily enzyme